MSPLLPVLLTSNTLGVASSDFCRQRNASSRVRQDLIERYHLQSQYRYTFYWRSRMPSPSQDCILVDLPRGIPAEFLRHVGCVASLLPLLPLLPVLPRVTRVRVLRPFHRQPFRVVLLFCTCRARDCQLACKAYHVGPMAKVPTFGVLRVLLLDHNAVRLSANDSTLL